MTLRRTCSHPEAIGLSAISYEVASDSNSPGHWEFASKWLIQPFRVFVAGTSDVDHQEQDTFERWVSGIETERRVIVLCAKCHASLPSQKEQKPQVPHDEQDPDPGGQDEIRERLEAGESLWSCPECNEVRSEDELVQVRECSRDSCGSAFDGANGRNCPDCNSPFSRLVLSEHGCPDCLSETECEPVTVESLDLAAKETKP